MPTPCSCRQSPPVMPLVQALSDRRSQDIAICKTNLAAAALGVRSSMRITNMLLNQTLSAAAAGTCWRPRSSGFAHSRMLL